MAHFTVGHQLRLLNTCFFCSRVRLILESKKWVELQEWIKDLSSLLYFCFQELGRKKNLCTRDLLAHLETFRARTGLRHRLTLGLKWCHQISLVSDPCCLISHTDSLLLRSISFTGLLHYSWVTCPSLNLPLGNMILWLVSA